MPKAKEVKKESCPNCKGDGVFEDEGQEKTCPCKAIED